MRLRDLRRTPAAGSSWDIEDDAARAILGRIATPSLDAVVDAIDKWATTAPVRNVRVYAFQDPEDFSEEAVIDVEVDASPDDGLALWDALAARVAEAKRALPQPDREALNRYLAVHLSW